MQRDDAEAVANMMAALADHHGDKAETNAACFIEHGLGPNSLATIWVATVSNAAVGFAATYDWMNFVRVHPVRHIDLLFVQEAYRDRGVGSALVAAIVEDATASRCARTTVGVASENHRAQAFYRKLGFEHRFDNSLRFQIAGEAFERA